MKNVDDIYTLTPVQQSMLAHALGGGDTAALTEQLSCTIEGPLNVEQFERAWQTTIDRHNVLRTCFVWDGLKEPLQVVRGEVKLPCRVDDLRALPPQEQQMRFDGMRQAERHNGFDLTQAPLLRLQLLRMRDEQWKLLWTCHHLILDGLSVPMVLRDAMTAYASGCRTTDSDRSTTNQGRISFRNYVAWLNNRNDADSKAFWQKELANLPSYTRLPTARLQRPFAVRQESQLVSRKLSSEVTQHLRDVAAKLTVSLNTVVQGAWALLLSRYTGNTDILFGVGISGRPDDLHGSNQMVGPMSGVVPMRVHAENDAECATWLQQLHATQNNLQQHQYAPLEDIAQWVGLPPGRRMFETLLVFENHAASVHDPLRIGDISIGEIQGTASSGYSLTIVVVPAADIELRAMFDPAIFDNVAIERMVDHLATLLHDLSENPHGRLDELRLLSKRQHDELLAGASANASPMVLDIAGHIAPVDVPGRLCGVEKMVATDQRAVRRDDGTIESLGPLDAPLHIGLYGVDPEIVATAIRGNRLIEDVAVVVQPDRQGETQLAAFIVPAQETRLAIARETGALVVSQLRKELTESLAAPLVPRLWCVVDQIPRRTDGKVDTQALPAASQSRDPALGDYVAPHNETEERLAAIWSEILGVAPIGIADSFLDLGGDSMSAVALLSRLKTDFDCKLPLVSLFQRPTITHLATLLQNNAGEMADNTLIPLRPEGDATPLFCVHPAGGTVFCYLEFAKHLQPGCPVYGIQAQGLDGLQPPHESLAAMATHYVQSLKSIQPQGPYQICGWSSGGVLAFELACQLQDAGEEVSLLALFDAGIPRPGESFDENDLVEMLGLMFPGESPEQIEAMQQADPERQMDFFRQRAEVAQILFAGSAGTQIQHVYHVFQANMAAVVAYQPRKFSGPVVLFRAAQRATPMHEDPQLGWGPWAAAGIEVHEVPGDHLTMFQSPDVEQITATMNRYLDSRSR